MPMGGAWEARNSAAPEARWMSNGGWPAPAKQTDPESGLTTRQAAVMNDLPRRMEKNSLFASLRRAEGDGPVSLPAWRKTSLVRVVRRAAEAPCPVASAIQKSQLPFGSRN